ncbi:MAG: acyltransferase [Bacteroidaceae bacterium]|nr:acyltransferase [Bacteroidaceae bacterium]
MKQRNHAFDLLCGICIIRMMMLHITNACGFGNADWWTPIMHWSYFFMSFFFFKAGYFNKTVSGNTKEYLLDKAKRLLIPYVVWGTIGNLIYFFFVIFIFDPNNALSKQVKLSHLWESSQFYGNIPCWFLFSFFMAYVVAHLITKVPPLFKLSIAGKTCNFKIHWFIFLLPFVSYWLWTKDNPMWFGFDNVFIGIYLFYLGRVWHFAIEKMGENITLGVSGILLALFIYFNATYIGEYTMADNIWKGSPIVTVADITLALCGLSGILLTIHLPRIPVINYIGEHSMVFFVAHYPLMMLYKMIRSANVRTLRGHWDDYAILIFILFGVCFLLVPYVEKVPWLSGRFKKKSVPLPPETQNPVNHVQQ